MTMVERCFICQEPTGKAGASEDSIYSDSGDLGPFCQSCWDREIGDLLAKNERLEGEVKALTKLNDLCWDAADSDSQKKMGAAICKWRGISDEEPINECSSVGPVSAKRATDTTSVGEGD